METMEKYKEKYNCETPELFHVQGNKGTSQTPVRMAHKHKHTFLSKSFSIGALAKKIYHHDGASNLFQQNPDPK